MPDISPLPQLGATRILAEWAAGVRFEDLPADVVTNAKRLLLDTLAVAWGGSRAANIDPVRELVGRYAGPAESTAWVYGDKISVLQAAFQNAMLAAALDFDSVHDVATVHADIVIVPALIALAERERLSGKELIAAMVVGDELAVRLGLAVHPQPGWFYSSVIGVFAAAAAAGRLLKFDALAIANSMGIALSRGAGSQQTLVDRSLTKRLQTAFAARDGLECALLGSCGITGVDAALEARFGFASLYGGLDWIKLVADLGRRYEMQGLSLKKYPSCLGNHAAIEATLKLLREHPVEAADISSAVVTLSPFMHGLVGAPFAPGKTPQVSAQFSAQYSVASALIRRKFDAADIDPAAVCDPAVGELARRVVVREDPANTGKFVPVSVAVTTTDGRVLEATVDALPGTPAQPLSDSELREKALTCFTQAARPMRLRDAEAFVQRIDALEALSDVRELFSD